MPFDAIVIGGGAAGLFCAARAAKRGKRILVIEKNAQLGRKILVSGGGRCNFTNLNVLPENFVSENKHFAKSALSRFSSADFVSLVEKYRIPFYEKKLGQLFCKDRAISILNMLETECSVGRVKILTDCSVKQIEKRDSGEFVLKTTQGEFETPKLIVASGGLSFPKLGASDFGYQIARQFGLEITKLRPSLVSLKAKDRSLSADLSGISLNAIVSIGKTQFRDDVLFTHSGMSGPAILQASNYWEPGKSIRINMIPDIDLRGYFRGSSENRQMLPNFLSRFIPKKLAESFTPPSVYNKRVNQLSQSDIDLVITAFTARDITFTETEGWDRAEVTLGGVSTSELSSQDMQSKKVSGLYFIGEIVDVTGWLGGYNFQWAWASADACASSI